MEEGWRGKLGALDRQRSGKLPTCQVSEAERAQEREREGAEKGAGV